MANPPDMDPPGKGQAPTFENRNDVPTIYFDIAPAYGVMSGIVQVELGSRVLVPHQDDTVDVRFVSCGAFAAVPPQPCISGTQSTPHSRCLSSRSPIQSAPQS